MICRRLEFSSWRPKLIVSEEQEPLKEFTTVSMGICEHNTPLQKTLDRLNPTTTHIDVDTYASLLQVCGSSNALSDGRHVHHHIMRHGHGAHMFLGFLILEMYGKCGAFEDAMAWFAEMPCRTVCVWNYMMGLYLRHGRSVSALRLFDQMLQEGMLADKITYISIISVCTSLTSLAEGKRINTRITGSGYESQVVVVTALVNLYGKCGDPNHARQLFDGMPRRDTITWNALISGYKQHRHGKEALQLFDQMQMEGVLPSRATFACTLSACASQVSLCQGKRMHVYIVQTGFESEFVIANALVRMYSQCGSLDDAQRLFDVLSNVNVVASNAMLAAYVQHGCLKEALKLLARMQHEGAIVDMISYISMLDVCGSQAALAEGKQMHACIKRSGYEREIIVGNALVSMYGRCQSLEDAQKVFDKMPDRDVVSWNAIISAYAQNRHGKEALRLFDDMQQAGMIPNKVTFICVLDAFTTQADLLDTKWFHTRVLLSGFGSDVKVATTLVNMHGKTGSLVDAQNIFDLIPEPNVVSWTAMISAHSLLGHDKEALQLFDQMLQQGAIPDMVTFLNTIGACTSQAALNEGKIMHVLLKQCAFESELPIANALVNMYGKCGYLGAAWDVFDRLPVRNIATWNVMIATHAQHGLGKEALCLLEQMQQTGVVPDKVTFVTYLSACSRAGLVDEAFGFLRYRNVNDFLVAPALEHYDCIVDLLGRAGQSHEAEIMIDIMPFQPTALSWMTLLTACRNLLDVEQGESSAKHVVEIDPKDHVPYVMLANIYAAVGREEDAEMILSIMINKEVLLSKENHTCQGQYFEEEYQGSYGLLFGCS